MRDLVRTISGLQGRVRNLVAFIAGLVSVLAMAPFHLFPVLFASFPVLVWLIDSSVDEADREASSISTGSYSWRARGVKAAITGWWFAFGYFFAGLFWIGEAFLVEAEKFAWALPFAVTLLPAGLALFWALALGVAGVAWRPGASRILAFAVTLSAAEWLRGHVLTGFPWNVPGYALTYPLPLMQMAGLFGIYGLTLLAGLIFTAPAVIRGDAHRPAGELPGLQQTSWLRRLGAPSILAFVIAVVPLAVMYGAGWLHLEEQRIKTLPDMTVRIVQPSVLQQDKWRPEHQKRIFDLHLSLSRKNASGEYDGLRDIKLLVWPEAAMPFLPLREPGALEQIASLLPDGTFLLSGALRVEDRIAQLPWSQRKIFNTALLIDSKGQPDSHYDKVHLVPFGEYLPFQKFLERIGLRQLSQIRGGFSTGVNPRPVLSLPGFPPIGMLICYEAIFPGVSAKSSERPGLLINLTNDGWFGNTTGPRQHLHQARVRTVEEGLPMIRAANNGISAVIDPYGRILQRLGMNIVGVIDARIPVGLPPPPYALYGDGIFAGMWLICTFILTANLYRFGLQKPSKLRANRDVMS